MWKSFQNVASERIIGAKADNKIAGIDGGSEMEKKLVLSLGFFY